MKSKTMPLFTKQVRHAVLRRGGDGDGDHVPHADRVEEAEAAAEDQVQDAAKERLEKQRRRQEQLRRRREDPSDDAQPFPRRL